jgi:hypothetical protein
VENQLPGLHLQNFDLHPMVWDINLAIIHDGVHVYHFPAWKRKRPMPLLAHPDWYISGL